VKFHLEASQEAIQDIVRGVLKDVCTPARRRKAVEGQFDDELWSALMGVGLSGLWVSESLGGAGLGVLEMVLSMEAIGAHAGPGPFAPHVLATLALSLSHNEAAKSRWLPALISGEAKGAVTFADGWVPQSWDLRLEANLLSGEIAFAHGVDVADVILVGVAGGALALVERSAPGVSITALAGSDLTRTICRISFTNAPAETVLTDNAAVQRVFDSALVLIAADALGGAQQCLDMAVEYAKTREQFGTVIGQFQALKHQLANMALEVEPSRALLWYAAYALDHQLPQASRVAAHAKAHMADRFVSVARMAVQVHGGIGYTWEYDLHLWFRRSMFDRAYLGAPSLHRERAAALAGW
jgi:alkylation response protein AidB-like acyl-CoA dehydrogenase